MADTRLDSRLSGAAWATAFPDSRRVADLEPRTRQRVRRFLRALHEAGARLQVTATRRPPQQAYLRHWAWAIAVGGQDPRGVPPMRGVDIEWWHGNLAASRQAAREMTAAFGDDSLAAAPALCSAATCGRTIAFRAAWSGKLGIRQAGGGISEVSSGPRDETHPGLRAVAAGFGLTADGPAWSPTGEATTTAGNRAVGSERAAGGWATRASREVTTPPDSAWRDELLGLMRQRAIAHAAPGRQLADSSGRQLPWVFYGWGVLLTSRGAALAAAGVLQALRRFESTQLASHGYGGLPIVTACVMAGGGQYTALAVRQERKSYGLRRLVEGEGDRSRPVVVVDDCLGAGGSLRKAIAALEADGYRVEGTIALAHFPWRGGQAWAQSMGFRVKTLFDIWSDLRAPVPAGPPRPLAAVPAVPTVGAVPDGLRPTAAVRLVIEQYLQTGTAPAPPGHFDADYDASGGLFISVRDRGCDARLAYEGFLRLDATERSPGLPAEVVALAVQTATGALSSFPAGGLDRTKIALSFFGPLTMTHVGALDADRHGLVVRSSVQPWKRGSVLPNVESWPTEVAQYLRAARRARLGPAEPHTMERFEVVRIAEPDSRWRPEGASAAPASAAPASAALTRLTEDERAGNALLQRARAVLRALAAGRPVPQLDPGCALPPTDVTGVGVTLYRNGIEGCVVTWGTALDDCLVRAVRGAWLDPRYAPHRQQGQAENLAILVSVLAQPRYLGRRTPAQVAPRIRLGRDSLLARDADRSGVLLAHVPCHYDFSAEQLARATQQKGRIVGERCQWWSYRTTMWLQRAPHVPALRILNGYPARPAAATAEAAAEPESAIELLAGYVQRQVGPDDLPAYCACPVPGRQVTDGTAARVILALHALGEAGRFLRRDDLRAAALRGLRRCVLALEAGADREHLQLPGLKASPAADCLLVAAIADARPGWLGRPAVQGLFLGPISRLVHPDGMISQLAPGRRMGADHEGLPGAVLLAIAKWNAATGRTDLLEKLDPCLAWYQRRFRAQPAWLAAWWQAEAWSALHRLTGRGNYAEFAFELADWALDRQLGKNGAFVIDLWPDGPSFLTACAAEAVADTWTVARRLGDRKRASSYADSWRAAMAFVDTLILREDDTYCAADPDSALGGVRLDPARSVVRIDVVAHTLLALVKGAQLDGGAAG